ncbi:MAG: DJ-1/PfpI family protein [Gammaproteobacteria bacterium]|nr:DJ-1 family protein [Gammaproteobacteria bacterium]NIN62950.1 DJ-1 family protein [Gammaproteobacteria bacterium]NIO63931.1 DJ-1 family protein [Gammaproteobacteria bacterium]NIP50309.1 DJ-1/PfpI family protein [Gammaproteobacteria bacterium]NIQ12529.1 DJ-1/PfpI family protein [Gammaproteobacteria bacterium]
MHRVLVPLAQGCEELEAVTIIDLLRRAKIEVVTAGLNDEPVVASRGVRLIPDISIDDAIDQNFDMIVLPGGLPGAEHLDNDMRIKSLLKKMANDEKYTAAICAAPKVLANAGILSNKKATGYPGFLDNLDLPDTDLKTDPVVIDGNVITSRGPGTAMDFALALIEILSGKDKRYEVEKTLVRG